LLSGGEVATVVQDRSSVIKELATPRGCDTRALRKPVASAAWYCRARPVSAGAVAWARDSWDGGADRPRRLQEPALPCRFRFWRLWFSTSRFPCFRYWLRADQYFWWLGNINLRMFVPLFVPAVTFVHSVDYSNDALGKLSAGLRYRGYRSTSICRIPN
jgi:hypothetical protein